MTFYPDYAIYHLYMWEKLYPINIHSFKNFTAQTPVIKDYFLMTEMPKYSHFENSRGPEMCTG